MPTPLYELYATAYEGESLLPEYNFTQKLNNKVFIDNFKKNLQGRLGMTPDAIGTYFNQSESSKPEPSTGTPVNSVEQPPAPQLQNETVLDTQTKSASIVTPTEEKSVNLTQTPSESTPIDSTSDIANFYAEDIAKLVYKVGLSSEYPVAAIRANASDKNYMKKVVSRLKEFPYMEDKLKSIQQEEGFATRSMFKQYFGQDPANTDLSSRDVDNLVKQAKDIEQIVKGRFKDGALKTFDEKVQGYKTLLNLRDLMDKDPKKAREFFKNVVEPDKRIEGEYKLALIRELGATDKTTQDLRQQSDPAAMLISNSELVEKEKWKKERFDINGEEYNDALLTYNGKLKSARDIVAFDLKQHQDEYEQKNAGKIEKVGNEMNQPTPAGIEYSARSKEEISKDWNITASSDLLKSLDKLIKQSEIHGQNWDLAGAKANAEQFALGIADAHLPLYDAKISTLMLKILNKQDDGKELRPDEQTLLRSYALLTDANQNLDRSFAFSIGQGVPNNLQFMASLALSSGIMGVVEKGVEGVSKKLLLKAAQKRIAGELGKKLATSTSTWAPQLLGNLVGNAAIVPLQPMFADMIGKNLLGTVNLKDGTDPQDFIVDSTRGDKMSPINAVANAFRRTAIENISESSGLLLDKGMRSIVKSPLAKRLLGIKNEFGLAKATRLNGVVSEILEEYVATAMNAPFDGWDKTMEQLTARNFAEIVVGTAIFTVPAGGYSAYQLHNRKKEIRTSAETLAKELGSEKFAEVDAILRLPTLEQRKLALDQFGKENKLTAKQQGLVLQHGMLRTIFDITEGIVDSKEVTSKLTQKEKDLRAIYRNDRTQELTALAQKFAPEEFKKISDARDAGLADDTKDDKQVERDYQLALGSLLRGDAIASETNRINRKYADKIHESTHGKNNKVPLGQSVLSDLDQALNRVKRNARASASEKVKGKDLNDVFQLHTETKQRVDAFENRDKRLAEIEQELQDANNDKSGNPIRRITIKTLPKTETENAESIGDPLEIKRAELTIEKLISSSKSLDEFSDRLPYVFNSDERQQVNKFVQDRIAGKTTQTFSEWRNEKGSTKTGRLTREKDALNAMTQEDYIKDTHELQYFEERKGSLQNIQGMGDTRNSRTRFDQEMVYTDEQENKQHLTHSPDLAEMNMVSDEVANMDAEIRNMEAELLRPMPADFEGKQEGLIWSEQRAKDREAYNEAIKERNRLKSEAETKFTDIHGPVNRGQRIAQTSTKELKKGQKVILRDAISGAEMNAEVLVEGEHQQSGDRYAIIQFQTKDGKKYQLTYTPGENSDYQLYESKDHESRVETDGYYAGKPSERVFKQQAMLDRWKQTRKQNDFKSYKTRDAAWTKQQEFVNAWGADMVSDLFQKDNGDWTFRLRNASVETAEERTNRIEQEGLHARKMGIVDYLQEMQDFYGHMSENELKAQLFAIENGDDQYRSYDQWVAEKKALLERAQVLSHESRDGAEDLTLSEMELIQRQAQVTKATNHLVSMTGTPIVFVPEDTERKKSGGKERKGWQQGDAYVVNLEKATLDTPIHEYAHPIFDAIETENRPLFDRLYSELESTEEGRQIIDFVKKEYPDRSDQYQKKEALVTAVGKAGLLASKYDLNPFAKAIYKIRTVINNWIAKNVRHKGITIDTTLGELAEMIVNGRIKVKDISQQKFTELHEAKSGLKESVISAVKEGQPFWIQYQSKRAEDAGEIPKWVQIYPGATVSSDGTQIVNEQHPEESERKSYNIVNDRLKDFSLTEPAPEQDNIEVGIKSGFQGYKGGFENIGKGTPEGDGKDKAMRKIADGFIGEIIKPNSSSQTSKNEIINKTNKSDQSQNLPTSGINVPIQNMNSGGDMIMLARNSEFKGKELLPETKYFINNANLSGAKFVVGDMPGVDSQFIDYLQEIGAKFTIYHTGNESRIKVDESVVPKVETPIITPVVPAIYTSPTTKTKTAFKETMTSAFDEYSKLFNDKESKLNKAEKIRQATKSALKTFEQSEYYKTLITSDERKQYNQILTDLIGKMLRKQKNVIDEAGLQSSIEAIDGVAATSEEKMAQFEKGFTPILNAIASEVKMSPVQLKVTFLDMFQKGGLQSPIVSTKKDFEKLWLQYSDEKHIEIAKALVGNPAIDFATYRSIANFFGSIHIEDQYGIRINAEIINKVKVYTSELYNQVTSISEKNLRADFATFNARMSDAKNLAKIKEAIAKYQVWANAEYKKFTTQEGEERDPLTQEYLNEFIDLISGVTGFEKDIIKQYLDNPKATEKLFIKKDGIFEPVNGQTFNNLVGQRIYKDKSNKSSVNTIGMASALVFQIVKNPKGLSLQTLIRNFMTYTAGKSSNLDFLVESFTRNEQSGTEGLNVEGDRFQTFSLNHHLYQTTKLLPSRIEDALLAEYYKTTPMRLAKFDGIKNIDTDKSFANTNLDQESLWFGMLMAFNIDGNEYQQFLGQFSDKTTVYTGNALKRTNAEDYDSAKKINPRIDKDIEYIQKIVERNFSQFGFVGDQFDQMKKMATDFSVSFTLNLDAIGTVVHGKEFIRDTTKRQYKGLDDLIKRSQVTISPGYNYVTDVEGGVAKEIRYVIVDDYIMRDLKGMGIEQLDGQNIGSEEYMKAAQISSGSILSNEEQFTVLDGIKGAVSYVNEFGERILIKSNITNILTYSKTFDDAIYQRLKEYMTRHKIDVLSFPSSAKKFGTHETTSLFFNLLTPTVSITNTDKTWDATEFINGLNLVGLQKQGEDQVTLYEKERDEEMQKGIAFQDTKAYQKLKQNLLTRLSTSEVLKSVFREQMALANEEKKQDIFFDNQSYGIDVLTALNEVAEEILQKEEINESMYNAPKILLIPRENFFVQQDLRHEKAPHAQDISTQIYTNFVTLPGYNKFVKNLTDANKIQFNFNKKFFNGFQDKEILREYLLFNIDKTADTDFYAMVDAWAINDPTFSNKVSSKLVNILNRDILEVNISRQSSFEIGDMTGKLKGLRKITDSEGAERSLLPEIGVNIPGIRYGKEFKTREEAINFMNDNKESLIDLQNDNFTLQFWQVYKDGNKWIVPGEPVISSRTPAGNLNCHTVARARYKINSSAAITMLDIESRRRSGSDFDGDARYNWTLSKHDGNTLLDNTYQGKINQALMIAVRDYENVQNLDKINAPIDTEAFDGIIQSLGIKESTNADFRNLKDQEKFRSRNMTGYNMKGIMSNLTTAFSYLNHFEVQGIVRDEFNMVKIALDNLLNLSFDNAKDPKIEKLGLNESTASMFVYELITDSSIDKATTAEEAKQAVHNVMVRLVDKYSDYNFLQDGIVYTFLNLIKEDKKNLFSVENSIIKRLKAVHGTAQEELKNKGFGGMDAEFFEMLSPENKKEYQRLLDKDFEWSVFLSNYYKGKDLDAFARVKGLRDGIPHKMSAFLLARANMNEFVNGKDMPRFYDNANIAGQDGIKPALSAIYMSMELGQNVFNNIPGMKFINGLIDYANSEYNSARRSAYDKAKIVSNTITDENDEIVPLTTIRHLPYLLGIRGGLSFKTNTEYLVSKIRVYERIQAMSWEDRRKAGISEEQDKPNAFIDSLVYDEKGDYWNIRIAPSTSNTKLSEQYTQQLRTAFDFMSEDLQDAFAYNTLIAYGFNEGIKGGGYFGLISPETRIRMSEQTITDVNDYVFSALRNRISNEVRDYAQEKGKSSVSTDLEFSDRQIPGIKEILIDEQLNLEKLPFIPSATTDKAIDQLEGKEVDSPISAERLAQNQEAMGIKDKDEFVYLLKKLQNAYKNVKHQIDNTNDFTEIILQDPALFAYMFNHFKSVYPDLKVFNNATEFATFVESQTKNGEFNLTAIGAAFANAVYLSNNARQDTFFHEVAHTYWDALDSKDSVKMNLRSLYGWKDSMSKKEKNEIDEKIIQDIGKIGTERTLLRFKGDRLQLFLSYLQQFWERVKSTFGLTAKSRAEAKMFFLNQTMADQIWNNGTEIPQSAIDAVVKHQISKTDYVNTTVNGRDISSAETWFRSQLLSTENTKEQLESAYSQYENDKRNLSVSPTGQYDSFNGDMVYIDPTGKMFLKDESGNIVGSPVNPKEITRLTFEDTYLTTQRRQRVLDQAIRAMIKGSKESSGIANFNINREQFEFDEFFEDPIKAYMEIRKIVNDLKEQFNKATNGLTDAQFVLSPALFDDTSNHMTYVDAMGIDADGNTTIIRIVPTFVSFNKNGVETGAYTDQTGSFTKNSPLSGTPSSEKEKTRLEMIQFATMLGKPNTKMITIPILLNLKDGKVESIEREAQSNFDFTEEDRVLGERILAKVAEEKSKTNSFNLNNLIVWAKATMNESDAVEMTKKAIKSLQKLTGSISTILPTHNVLLNAKLGYGKLLNDIKALGWSMNQFLFEPNENIVEETRKFTSKIALKDDGSGQLLYGSPGWGKKLASSLSSDFVDSSYLLEEILFTAKSRARLLSSNSPVQAILTEYSKYHEVDDVKNDGTMKKMTWASLLQDYYNGNWSKELLASKASSLIDQLRKIAIQELIDTGYYDFLKNINPNDIVDVRNALKGKTGDAIDMINIDTPYEELKTSIEQQLANGKHVLTSTLPEAKNRHLFDMKYDHVYRLVQDVTNESENQNSDSKTGSLGMHHRSVSDKNTTYENFHNQEFLTNRFKTEIERFGDNSNVSYVDGYAIDDLFKEKLSTKDGKITDMKVLYYINHFKITLAEFDKAAKEDPELTISNYVLNRAKAYYSGSFMEYDVDGNPTRSAETVFNGIIKREKERIKGTEADVFIHAMLGLKSAPDTESEYYDAVILYQKNRTQAETTWKELGSFGKFISMYDNSSHKTDKDRWLNQRKLGGIFERISKLDKLNQDGLYDIVASQIATNYVLDKVREEATNDVAGTGYRMYTVLLDKMMNDPSFSWVDTEGKWKWAGVDWTHLIHRMSTTVVNLKLDRSVDIKHTMGQALVGARMHNDNHVFKDSMEIRSKMNELFAQMTDADKEQMIYLYGTKEAIRNSTGELIYAGDRYTKYRNRYAFLSVNEAMELVSQGKMSMKAYEYINLVRSYMMKYDEKYYNQQLRTNYQAPTFVPDFIATKETGRFTNSLGNHSEFVRGVKDAYGIDISNDGSFIDRLHKALDTSKEGGYTLIDLEDFENDNLVIYEGMTLSQAKRQIFLPEAVIAEAADANISVRELLNQKIRDFELLRDWANEKAVSRYEEQDRQFKTHGAYSKGIILRTQNFNAATQMYLNSLVLNYHTLASTPFAYMAEDKYKTYADGSPIMAIWSKKYIDANFFKYKQSGSEAWNKFWKITGLYTSLRSLGLSPIAGVGNLTAGMLQTFFLHRKDFVGAVARINQLPKVVNLMHNNHIGMVLEDIDLKEVSKKLEQLTKFGFIFTEHIENFNQGMGFLSQMTDDELAMYDNKGQLKPGAKGMSLHRIFQIEAKIREINGDYGKNRALYRTDPLLMEWGRFKMGWWQAMIQTHFAGAYVDMWGEEHKSEMGSIGEGFQRIAFRVLHSKLFNWKSRNEIAKRAFATMTKKSLGKIVSDTEQEAIAKISAGNKISASIKVFPLNINGTTKYLAIDSNQETSLWMAMVYEMMVNIDQRDFSKANAKDKEQYGRALWELGVATLFTVTSGMILYTLTGLGEGAGDPENDGDVSLWLAFLEGLRHFGLANLFNPAGAKPIIPLNPLTQYSSLNKEEWAKKYALEMLNTYATRSLSDVLVPYDPTQWGKIGDGTNIPIVKQYQIMANLGKELFTNPLGTFGYISEKRGFNADTNKALYYLRQLTPIFGKSLDIGYRYFYMDKAHLEASQVDAIAKRNFIDTYKRSYGYKGTSPDFSDPKIMRKLDAQREEANAHYFSGEERIKQRGYAKQTEMDAVGAKNIKEELKNVRIDIDAIEEAKRKYGKRR